MRGRGGPRPVVPVEEPYRVNERIRLPEVRVILENEAGEDENLGVMPTHQALKLAQARDLDLVEVAPQAQPPVCKIMDYGRFKYQMERKSREAHRSGRAGRAASEMKDVQFSPRIDEHDMAFKVERARNFLAEGHPVRMVVRFLGRDMRHPEVGMQVLQQALDRLRSRAPITVDQQPRMEGRQLFALVRLQKGAKIADKKAAARDGGEVAEPEAAVVQEPARPAPVVPEVSAPAVAESEQGAPAERVPEPVAAGS